MTMTARAAADNAKPRRLARKKPLRFKPRMPGAMWRDVMEERPLGGRVRAVRRLATIILWTLLCIPVQGLLVLLPGPAKNSFARVYHRTLCWLIGLRLQVVGRAAPGATLFVSNHSSWLDVLVLGAVLDARFVSKAEVAGWPLIGWVARLGRCVFVSRNRTPHRRRGGCDGRPAARRRGPDPVPGGHHQRRHPRAALPQQLLLGGRATPRRSSR